MRAIDPASGQDTLERYAADKAFYDARLASNGSLLSLYRGTAPDSDKQAFFQQSTAHWDTLNKFVAEQLATVLPDTPFFGGASPSEDDFHLAPWLARIAFVVGDGSEQDSARALENGFRIELHPKVSAYVGAWSSRKSWKEVYAQGLH